MGSNLTGATWSATGLPSGITINSATGFLVGTPTAAATTTITVTATNGCGAASCGFVLTVTDPPCSLSVGTSGGGNTTDTYDVTGKFTIARSIYIRVTADAGAGATAQFQVAFNGSTLYDSGCISATSANATVTGPSGTTSIVVTITAPCAGGTAGWDYVICCSGDCT